MPKNEDLHGNAPDKSETALLIIDMISDFEFDSGDKILPFAEAIAKNIAALKKKAEKAKIAVIYVNDNFGKWRSDFKKQLKHSQSKSVRGHKIARMLAPKENDYFVLKAKHSAFYSTTLDLLLAYLGAKTLILTGVASDICILFTANDAYMRDYDLFVPCDCVAALDEKTNESTLRYMEKVLKADTRASDELDFKKLN
ncbi:MAG TPA: isochorismatase family cysteine hydrolase [Pyrinomonadaceae bacterium]|jgi:nicotinamidase-related amidase